MQTVTNKFFDQLMSFYLERVEYAQQALALLKKHEEPFNNDHVAFRTFGLPGVGIAALEKVFLKLGYVRMDYMHFEEKKLNAYWYKPYHLSLPKVFISELRVEDFPQECQDTIEKYTNQVQASYTETFSLDNLESLLKIFEGRPWALPSYEDYELLNKYSEYAAWVLMFANQVNHFTISVNSLQHFQNITELNNALEEEGIPLNEAGGKIKGTPEQKLMQSSTVANTIPIKFSDGTHDIPYSYMEFAERFPEDSHQNTPPERLKAHHYFHGFIPKSANKIFESTYHDQVNR